MAMRIFLVYVLVELAVVIALVSTIGFGWTFLLVVGVFALGLALAGSQVKRQVQRLRAGLSSPQDTMPDGVLVALGILLTVVPGLVTSALGLLLLLPPTRAAARPAVAALAARRLGRMPVIVVNGTPGPGGPYRPGGRRGYVDGVVDGEVIDVSDVSDASYASDGEPLRLPKRPE